MSMRELAKRRFSIAQAVGVLLLMLIGLVPQSGVEAAQAATTWRALPCSSCEKASITLEVRQSVDQRGRAGNYVSVRVRNRNRFEVIFRLELIFGNAPLEDGVIRLDARVVNLAPAGDLGAETVMLLQRSDVTEAALSGLERFQTEDASAGRLVVPR